MIRTASHRAMLENLSDLFGYLLRGHPAQISKARDLLDLGHGGKLSWAQILRH